MVINSTFDRDSNTSCNSQVRMSPATKAFITRLVLVPIMYVVLRIPGTFGKLYTVYGVDGVIDDIATAFAFFLSQANGLVNFIILVVVDKKHHEFWRKYLVKLGILSPSSVQSTVNNNVEIRDSSIFSMSFALDAGGVPSESAPSMKSSIVRYNMEKSLLNNLELPTMLTKDNL